MSGPGEGGRRTVVTVRGDLDLDAAHRLRPELFSALSRSADGLELDLGDVNFCDCSGLNLLLSLRQEAIRRGKTVTIRSLSPVVERLLDLTGATFLYAPTDEADEQAPGTPEEPAKEPAKEPTEDLRTTVTQLRRAMQTRPTIDLARGILMSSFDLSPESAWDVLVTASQNTNTKLHSLAEELVNATVQGDALPKGVRTRMVAVAAAAVETAAATAGSTPRTAQPPPKGAA
ncbi:anti-sigma factor antagonist [Streptomyces aureocirculatus]|uniref:anti-sigma factor antagonist n=1 Tax=Streptomyces aureocirculatus TaxID=67275 RepID=UPI0004C81CC4|nr:anti-sigma factor antagonist [Streptomyces aureocirculatus]